MKSDQPGRGFPSVAPMLQLMSDRLAVNSQHPLKLLRNYQQNADSI
jgi:hypothetical protein